MGCWPNPEDGAVGGAENLLPLFRDPAPIFSNSLVAPSGCNRTGEEKIRVARRLKKPQATDTLPQNPRGSAQTLGGSTFALRAPCSLRPLGHLRCASSATPVVSVGLTQISPRKPPNHSRKPPRQKTAQAGSSSLPKILCRWDLNRFADLAPAGEIPFVGKSTALEGLHGLDAAVAPFEEDARAIGLVGEGESIAAGPEAGEFLDELDFRHFEKIGDRADVGVREFHKPRPAAAVRAALAGVAGRGGKTIRRAAFLAGGN